MSDVERAVQLFAAISFLVIGLSHVLQRETWVDFFQALAAKGKSGAFVEGFLLLNFGAIVVAFHNVWQGPAIVLTLIGWSQVLKGVVRFVFPDVALRIMRRLTRERAWQIQIGGLFALSVSAFLFWLRYHP